MSRTPLEVGIRDEDVYRVASRIAPGSVVLDVGANVGVFSVWAAGRGARVTAVEPWPANVEALRIAVRGLDVAVLHAAVGGANGFCEVYPGVSDDPVAVSGGAHTIAGWGRTPMLSLSSLVHVAGGRVDVLKMDVEGAEYDAFAGATPETLASIDYVTLEFHAWRAIGSVPDGMRGERRGVMPPDALTNLLATLSVTHQPVVEGAAEAGGMIFAERRP